MTPHIKANKGDFAKVVLMPGDPLRAKWIAENYLTEAKKVNDVRGMLAYTGTYKGIRVSVMGHGMGIPSIGIYAYELFHFFDVELIIRVGSAGSYRENINVGDLLLVKGAYSESSFADQIGLEDASRIIYANPNLNLFALNVAKKYDIKVKEIIAHSSDAFYNDDTVQELVDKTSSDVVEMEAFALFAIAKKLNKKALCLLTCSDSLVTHEALDSDQRVTSFGNMIKYAFRIVESMFN